MSHPALPSDVIKTTDILYYRFHGIPHLYTSKYEVQQLEQVAEAIQQHNGADNNVFIYFNNTAEGASIGNAIELQRLSELVH
jgi:uncharacterized protein YecE (DUF72 family)